MAEYLNRDSTYLKTDERKLCRQMLLKYKNFAVILKNRFSSHLSNCLEKERCFNKLVIVLLKQNTKDGLVFILQTSLQRNKTRVQVGCEHIYLNALRWLLLMVYAFSKHLSSITFFKNSKIHQNVHLPKKRKSAFSVIFIKINKSLQQHISNIIATYFLFWKNIIRKKNNK